MSTSVNEAVFMLLDSKSFKLLDTKQCSCHLLLICYPLKCVMHNLHVTADSCQLIVHGAFPRGGTLSD